MAGHWDIVVPEAGTNLITNPSFETNTTGWALDGTNTIARSTAQGRFGAYSLLCTYQDDTDLARYAITLTAAAHTFSVYVYLGSTWDGGAIQLAFEDFAGGAVTIATTTTTTLSTWVRLQATYTPVGGDLIGSLVVETAGAPTAGRFIYVDAAVCTTGTYVTTYIDGDQGGCSWNGAAHGSISTRSATSRAGGRVRDLKDDYGFLISRIVDAGMSPLTQHLDEFAIIRGGEVSGYKVHPRVFVLSGTIYSQSGWADLNSQIQGLENVFRPDAVPGNQPALLRYTAAAVTKEIAVHYESGLGDNLDARAWRTNVAVRLLAADPTFYSEGESAQALDTIDDLTLYSVAGRLKATGVWDALNLSDDPDAGGSIRAVLYASDGSIYIGGDFADLNNTGTGIDRIAKYTPSTDVWSLVGSGSDISNGTVRCLAEDAVGDIYVGGTCTAIGGNGDMDYIAKWDISGSTWVALGDPDSGGAAGWGGVYDMAFAPNGNLYIVGDFTGFGGIGAAADYVMLWNGTVWAAVGNPDSGGAAITEIRAIGVVGNTHIVVGGNFTNLSGEANADYAARFSTVWTAWWPGAGLWNAPVNSIYITSGGTQYFGGEFTNALSGSGDYALKYNGGWSALSSGMNGIVWDIAEDPAGNIIFTGEFTTAGGTVVDRIAFWNGSAFSATDITIGTTVQCVVTGAVDPDDSSSYDWYIGLGAKATLTDAVAGTATVTNDGNTEAFPRFVFKRSGGTSATIRQIGNLETSKDLFFNYALQNGETLTIDLLDKTIISDVRGSQYGAVFAGSDFGSFSLLPGENTVICFVPVVGAPTLTANVIWRNAYWGIS